MYALGEYIGHLSNNELAEIFGFDTAETLEAEAAWRDEEQAIVDQDRMEAAGGPVRYALKDEDLPW